MDVVPVLALGYAVDGPFCAAPDLRRPRLIGVGIRLPVEGPIMGDRR